MKVRELISKLQNEDAESQVVIILSRYRHERLSALMEAYRGYFDEITVDGKEAEGHSSFTVIIADR